MRTVSKVKRRLPASSHILMLKRRITYKVKVVKKRATSGLVTRAISTSTRERSLKLVSQKT